MEAKRILGFDVARIFSIIWIVAVYHVLPSAGLPLTSQIKIITYTSLGIFTFLSAFLLTSRYSFDDLGGTLLFYKKRVLRFYPLFLLSSVILCAIGYNTLSTTLKGLLGISPFWKPHPTTMWYCAMLILLYLITPIWATGGLKKQIVKFVATMAIICLIEIEFHTVVPRTFCYYPVYFMGIIVAQRGYNFFLSLIKNARFALVSLLFFLLLFLLAWFINDTAFVIFCSMIGIISMLSVYMNIGEWINKKSNKKLERTILMLSYSSMCMYLFHREVHCLFLSIYKPSNPIIMLLYLGLIGLLITIPLSYYIQLIYDKSINKISI